MAVAGYDDVSLKNEETGVNDVFLLHNQGPDEIVPHSQLKKTLGQRLSDLKTILITKEGLLGKSRDPRKHGF